MRDAAARPPFFRRLYVRIYLALLASLAVASTLFAIAHLRDLPGHLGSTLGTYAEVASEVLPPPGAARAEQEAALWRWHSRIHANLALYGADGKLIAAAGRPLPALSAAQTESARLGAHPSVFALELPDGRWLLGQRMQARRATLILLATIALIALVVGAGAYPVVRRLTRRLERLQRSVETWGGGRLSTRVAVEGADEVARLASSFNHSAERIEELVGAQKALLANASHELRSPLARIRMAIELMQEQAAPALRTELTRNIAELDQLIDELLLASRLDASTGAVEVDTDVGLTGIVAEECARVNASLETAVLGMRGDPRLIRRMVRNLLENAKRHGAGTPIAVRLGAPSANTIELEVCDGGPGVPPGQRELIFTPFYRLPGASESAGGVGLGLSLVRQIARRHGGAVACLPNEHGGACFRVTLPRA